ncbi:hypothetical protein HDU99_004584, partial [Rhizoclosmatium hyalinum]
MATREELQPLLYTSDSKLKRICFSFRHFVRRAELHGIARRLVLTNNTYAKLLMEPDAANVLQTWYCDKAVMHSEQKDYEEPMDDCENKNKDDEQ